MRDVEKFIVKAQEIYGYDHFINDAGGSLVELDDERTIKTLADNTLILYLKPDAQLERALVQRAIDDPKPLYYQESFLDAKLAEYLAEAELDSAGQDRAGRVRALDLSRARRASAAALRGARASSTATRSTRGSRKRSRASRIFSTASRARSTDARRAQPAATSAHTQAADHRRNRDGRAHRLPAARAQPLDARPAREREPAAEAHDEAEQMRGEIRVLARGAREREQPDARDDRRDPRAPRRLAQEAAAPRVRGEQAERREHGRRRADRAVRGRLDHGVQRVRERARAEDREPTDAAAEVAPDEIAEERAEHEVAAEVIDVDVHRERGDRAPPFAARRPARFEATRAEPVEIEHALVQADEHGKQDRDVHGDARQRAADFLDAPLPDGRLFSVTYCASSPRRLRRARRRNPDLPTRAARQSAGARCRARSARARAPPARCSFAAVATAIHGSA